MKKLVIITTTVWIITIAIILIMTMDDGKTDKTYKILINRIHQKLTSDIEENYLVINGLSDKELGNIQSIDMIHSGGITDDNSFFEVEDLYQNPIVYKQIASTDIIVRYHIHLINQETTEKVILLGIIVTLAYLFILVNIIGLNRNVVKPMDELTYITKQLATGYIGEINIHNNNKHFKDFIWGLDMLREQLSYDREKITKLEKERKTLVASLSHDIKTPLSSIKNYTIALKEDVYNSETERNKALDIIMDKTETIDKLTKQLLDSSINTWANLEVKPKEVYLLDIHKRVNRLIHQRIDLLHMEYKETQIIDNLMLMVDMDRLLEVFDNIVENALKYGDKNKMELNYYIEENYQLIEIRNTGNPISETEIKHIFTSYYRGSNVSDKPGYGLGLYISKQLMKSMNGDIYAKNNENGVSLFVVIRQA